MDDLISSEVSSSEKIIEIQNADTDSKESQQKNPIETIPSSFKPNSNYNEKRKNFHQRPSNYFIDRHNNNHNNHHQNYPMNYSNINTMNKSHRTNSVTYYPGQRYNNQNINKNINNNESRSKNFGGGNYLGKKKKISTITEVNQNNEYNNSSKSNSINKNKNINSPNFVHPYPESQDFEHYQHFKNLNLKFLKQNYKMKGDIPNEEENDLLNGLGFNNLQGGGIQNVSNNQVNNSSNPSALANLMKLNFNGPHSGWNFGPFNNQLNMFYMINLINSQNNINNPNLNQNLNNLNNLQKNQNQNQIVQNNNNNNNNQKNNNKIVNPLLLNPININQPLNNMTNMNGLNNINNINSINNINNSINNITNINNINNLNMALYNQMNNNKFKSILLHQSQTQNNQTQSQQQNQNQNHTIQQQQQSPQQQQNAQNPIQNQINTKEIKSQSPSAINPQQQQKINNQINKHLNNNLIGNNQSSTTNNNNVSQNQSNVTGIQNNNNQKVTNNNVNNNNHLNNNNNFINAFNSLVQQYIITLQTQREIVNKMTQLFASYPVSNSIINHSDFISNINQLKNIINNEMSQVISSVKQQNTNNPNNNTNSLSPSNNNNNINNSNNNSSTSTSLLNNNTNINNNQNNNSSQIQNGLNLQVNNEQNIQNILSVWSQEKFIKPYAPLLKLSKSSTYKQNNNPNPTGANNPNLNYNNLFNHNYNPNQLNTNLNISTMTFNNMNMNINGINQNFLLQSSDQDFNRQVIENVLDDKQIEEFLKTGQCLTGVIRMNKSLNHGYITIPGVDNDVLIKGTKNLNQCLNLDEVVVELFPINQWKPLINKKTRKFSHVNEEGLLNTITKNLASASSSNSNNKNNEEKNENKTGKDDNNTNYNNNKDEEGLISDNFSSKEDRLKYINKVYDLRPEGRIVKILKSPNKEKEQICKIQIEKKYIFALPIDDTIPKILINEKKPLNAINSNNNNLNNNNQNILNMNKLNIFNNKQIKGNYYSKEEFEREFGAYKKKYFLVKIHGFSNVGNVYRGPTGYILNEIGTCGDIDVESEVLLKQYNIDYNENFSEEIMKEIHKKMEEIKINDEYIKNTERTDLRNELVFTIDPATSKDLDDAIHVKVIDQEKKLIEVGVHISDPTTYIEKGSLLDKEAINRATSVYLVQKNIPMLPRILSETVCSIMPKKDTLSVSCIFRIYLESGRLDDTFTPYFCLSVVRSRAKWNYNLVQDIIEGKEIKFEEMNPDDGTKPENEEILEQLKESVKILYELTKLVRKQRFQSGSLMIDNNEIKFTLDPGTEMPVSYELEEINEAHYLIGELMLITNKLCADYIYKNIKKYSLIRRHQFLNDNKFNEIQRYFSINKINSLDFDDPQELNKLLKDMELNNINKYLCIQHKLKTFMLRAEYVLACQFSYEELRHSALNFDLYTHFTAPIRRYPDIIVHRQLKAILLKSKNGENKDNDYKEFKTYLPLMDQFNEKYSNAKYISQKSRRIFQCLYLKNAPPKIYDALIMDIIYKNNNNKRNINNNMNMNLNMNLNNNYGMGLNNVGNQSNNEEDDIFLVLYVPEINIELEWRKGDNDNIIFDKYDKSKNELYIDYKIDDKGLKSKYLRTFDLVQVRLISLDSIPIDVKCVIELN